MNTLDFDFRRDMKQHGYSGSVVMRDDKGSVSFLHGTSIEMKHRRYVSVDYAGFKLLFDREDLTDPHDVGVEKLTRESPISEWYMTAVTALLGKLGPVEFLGLIRTVHANGKAEGDALARAEIRHVLGMHDRSNSP